MILFVSLPIFPRRLRRIMAIAALGLLSSTFAAANAVSASLISFGPGGYSIKNARTEDAVLTVTGESSLSVAFGTEKRWPGITFEGDWNVSEYEYANIEVSNRGDISVQLEFLLYDDLRRDWKRSINRRGLLSPGETKTISVQLVRRGSPGDRVVISGANGVPSGLPALRGIDTARLRAITLSKGQDGRPAKLEIKRIYLSGSYSALDQSALLPLVDRFGQYRHADWPGKIHGEGELAAVTDAEAADLAENPGPADRNRFGGWEAGPQLDATGRFRVEKHQGKWTLVDPEGRLFFSLGVNHVNVAGSGTYTPVTIERNGWFESLPAPNDWINNGRFYNVRQIYTGDYSGRMEPGFSFIAWNLSRKYGRSWEQVGREIAHRRLRSWGYNTLGNWSDASIESMQRTPYTVGVALAGSPARPIGGKAWTMGKVWDSHDPEFAKHVDRAISGLKGRAASPWCIGVFFDNELYWDEDFGLTALASSPDQPAKQTFVADLRGKYGDIAALNQAWETNYANWEALLRSDSSPTGSGARPDLDAFYLKTAEAYFRTIRDSIHRQLPGSLYLGPRFARITPLAYRAAAKYCDVISINLYRDDLTDYRAPSSEDAPLMVGEFHFGATDRGMWAGGLVPVATQRDRAELFERYVTSALDHPQFVGCHWFEYYDQPLTGRSFDGENYAHGLLTGTDSPYAELRNAARKLSATLYPTRYNRP